MFVESDNFIVDKLQSKDKDNLRGLEESRPWAKSLLGFAEKLSADNKSDYFERL